MPRIVRHNPVNWCGVRVNIKRLRGERGLTQEQLAEQLCVTRQTVSSWENNRTQPDIDMLTALSDALGADVEELIYGKRRSVGLEAPADDRAAAKRLSGVVLAVFGSLLLAAGCIELLRQFALPRLQQSLAFLPISIEGNMFLLIYLVLLVAGLIIGLIGSAFAMRRYLKV